MTRFNRLFAFVMGKPKLQEKINYKFSHTFFKRLFDFVICNSGFWKITSVYGRVSIYFFFLTTALTRSIFLAIT